MVNNGKQKLKDMKNLYKETNELFGFPGVNSKETRSAARAILANKGKIQSIYKIICDDDQQSPETSDTLKTTLEILENSPFGVYVINSNHKMVEYVNPTMYEISGDINKRLLGSNVFTLPSYNKVGLLDKINKAFETKRAQFLNSIKFTSFYGNKTTIRNFTVIPYINDSEEKAIIFVEDVTEKTRLEKQFQHAQKMELIGQLAGGTAHNFNNILTVMLGYAEILKMQNPGDSKLLDIIINSGHKGAELTRSLLAFSRNNVIEVKHINIGDMLQRIYKTVALILPKSIEFDLEFESNVTTVLGDESQIEQAVMNLIVNARDAIADNGKISIKVGVDDISSEKSEKLKLIDTGKYVRISLIDTGEGMSETTKQKMFEPFYTTKEIGKGTGLGLSMVYGTIKQHDGGIHVETEKGKGTRFDLYFPFKELTKEDYIREKNEMKVGSETILVVEDDEDIRELSKTILSYLGYRVILAENGAEGLKRYHEHHGLIDMVITDAIMPTMNGSELYEEIAKINPNIKVLFMSGYAKEIIKSGDGKNFLQKPITFEILSGKVREILDRR